MTVTAEDIRNLRHRWGLSQQGLERLLGSEGDAVADYETGMVPDSTLSDLLWLLLNDVNMAAYIRRYAATRLTSEERARVDVLLHERGEADRERAAYAVYTGTDAHRVSHEDAHRWAEGPANED